MKKIVLSAVFAVFGTFAMAQQDGKMMQKDPAQMEQKRAESIRISTFAFLLLISQALLYPIY